MRFVEDDLLADYKEPVGIVIPVKNSGENIKHAIRTIFETTDYPFEMFIVDGGSTDGTEKVVDIWAERFENIHSYHIKSKGIVDAMNYGIERTKEFNCEGIYLTQDDVIHFRLFKKDWLQILVEMGKIKNCGQVISMGAGGVSGDTYVDGLHWAGTWSTYIPMRVINEIGLFDENFNPGCGDDIDYSYRVQKAGLILYQAPFWVDHHRMSEHTISREKDEKASEKLKDEHSKFFKRKWRL